MILTAFDYVRPVGVDEALTLLAGTPGARILAGGQSLLPGLRTGEADPGGTGTRLLVDVRRLDELRGTERTPGGLRIGALTTLAELAADPLVLTEAPELAAAARANGDPQVRNLGTVGGNLAAPGRATDLPVAALAADALVELAAPGGRSTLTAEEFTAGGAPPGALITALLVPAAGPAAAFEKTADRATRYPVCAVAVRITPDGPRIAVTGATARALRPHGIEERLRGRDAYPTPVVLAAFRAEPRELFVPGRGTSAEYLGHLAGVLTARALARAQAAWTALG
ncbi:FAD binding domain-containing protein [Streptomyces sp. NBC_00536]|uniref:FAD binding domain-containing protein n=1 Tax=Streptomyces sp. NBC_00536 TaxID=2975769 RepID=UPI002E81B4C2|nr:FAD binding domain-containing protein [Streptomyces sp. NBC_00536]WUC78005.1 FAD binding domain-containing protein [Streptomyces sp. NBC_00536]